MYFYPKRIHQDARDALTTLGVNAQFVEIKISDDIIASHDEMNIIFKNGTHLAQKRITFGSHIDAPKTYSSLEDDMIYSGVDSNQCSICGYWMTRKDSSSDERQHDRTCEPQYQWELVK